MVRPPTGRGASLRPTREHLDQAELMSEEATVVEVMGLLIEELLRRSIPPWSVVALPEFV